MPTQVQGHLKILVVDDLPASEALRQVLGEYAVEPVTGLHKLRQRLSPESFPVGIIDLGLEWAATPDFFARLKALYPETAWILHTAAVDVQPYVRAINQGVVSCLPKPCAPQALQEAVRAAMGHYTSRMVASLPPDLHMDLHRLISEAVVVLDSRGAIQYANPALQRLLDMPASAVVGRSVGAVFGAAVCRDDSQRLKTYLHDVMQGRALPHAAHFRFETADAQVCWCEVAAYQSSGGKHGEDTVILILKDITVYLANEKHLQESEQRFRRLSESTREAVVLHDGEHILDANSAALALFGCSLEEFIGSHYLDYLDPQDHEQVRERVRAHDEEPYQTRILNRAGNAIPVEARGSTILLDGQMIRVVVVRDLTYERQVINELTRLSMAVEFSPAIVVLTDPQGNIEYVNPKFTEVTGYTLQEVHGENPRILQSGQTPPETYEELWRTILNGGEWQGEFANRKKNGEIYWESARVAAIRDWDGNIIHFMAVKEDITEQRRYRDALQASEARFRIVSELTSDYAFSMLVTHDQVVSFEWWTEALLRITGYTPDELLANWQTFFHPDDMAVMLNHFRAFVSMEPNEAEFRIITRDGDIRWVANYIRPERVEGTSHAVRLVCAGRDITREKLAMEVVYDSETRFRTLFEVSPDGISMVDLQGNLILMNEQHARMHGYASVVDMLVASHFSLDFAAPEEREHLTDSLRRVLTSGKSASTKEINLLRRDGSVFPAEVNVSVLYSEAGTPNAIMSIVRDVTGRKAIEHALRRSQEQYRNIAELISDFAFSLGILEDGELDVEWTTSGFERLSGYSLEELPGYRDWLSLFGSDAVERIEDMTRVLLAGIPTAIEVSTHDRNGNMRNLLIYAKPAWEEERNRVTRIFGAVQDITVQRQAEQERLAQAKTIAALEERQALARDLHDAVSQSLFSANILAEMLIKNLRNQPADQVLASLGQLHHLTRSAQAEMRTLLLELRPTAIEEAAFEELINNLAIAVKTRSGVETELEIAPGLQLPPLEKVVFYRIAQEALNNVVKHAGATRVSVRLRDSGGQVQLTITDDGAGFSIKNTAGERMGLHIMRERANSIGATLQIDSGPGKGTSVRLFWPADDA